MISIRAGDFSLGRRFSLRRRVFIRVRRVVDLRGVAGCKRSTGERWGARIDVGGLVGCARERPHF